jgi:hypothetical protein
MPKKDHKKCQSCEEFYHIDDLYTANGISREAQLICETCYCEDDPACTYITPNSEETAYIGSYSRYTDGVWNDPSYDAIEEHADSIRWKSTDAWRGYYYGDEPNGYSSIIEGWTSGGWGGGTDEVNRFHEMWEKDRERFAGLRVFVACYRTSNVFSTAVDVYVHYEDEDALREIIGETEEA